MGQYKLIERNRKHKWFIIYRLYKSCHHFFFISSTQLSGSQVIPLLLSYFPTTKVSTGTISSLRVISLLMHYRHIVSILEDPGAASWDDAVFPGENLLQELRRANVNFHSD